MNTCTNYCVHAFHQLDPGIELDGIEHGIEGAGGPPHARAAPTDRHAHARRLGFDGSPLGKTTPRLSIVWYILR